MKVLLIVLAIIVGVITAQDDSFQRGQQRHPQHQQQPQHQQGQQPNQQQHQPQQQQHAQPQQHRGQQQPQQQQHAQPQQKRGQQQQQPQQQQQQPRQPQKKHQQQQTTTTPAPSGTLLALPVKESCASRPKQWQFGGHNYYFSWDQEVEPLKVNWLEARNECRKRCMDAVSMETEEENKMIFDFMRTRNITYIWTSGRLCDFKGCSQRKDLQPVNIKGWFWSNTNTKMALTNSIPAGWASQPWSQTGHNKVPQPDNAEFDINNTSESCLGVLNNLYQDGIKWHDIACYHKKPYICEDSDVLIEYIAST